jgi:signal transduction histidine kinase
MEDLLALVAAYDLEAHQLDGAARARIADKKRDIDFDFLVDDARKLVASVRAGADRTALIVRDLKMFSRQGTSSDALEETDLLGGIETILNLLAPLLKNRVTVHRDFQPAFPSVRCHPGHIHQVFMNILTNAAQAITGEGRIDVAAARVPGEDAVRIAIRDSGAGMAPEVLRQVFDPFFTTKDTEGTGLGLSLADSIVRAHGGTITCDSTPGQGSSFTVVLPLEPPAVRRSGRG